VGGGRDIVRALTGIRSVWDDPARWDDLGRGGACPICQHGAPLDVIAEFGATWVTAQAEAPLPAYVCVVSKRHVVEPFELTPDEQTAFWNEVMLVARAVHELVRPKKMNYEIHGNTIPHLHVHLLPRFAGDPYVGRPIDASRASFARTGDDLERLRKAISSARRPD